jgi:allantoin racemase
VRVLVIGGAAVTLKFAVALAMLRLKTSKQGDCARPLPKRYEAWAAALGWPPEG